MQRMLRHAVLSLTALLVPTTAFSQERIIFEQRRETASGSAFVKRVVYSGEGWRNVRQIAFQRLIGDGAAARVVTEQTGYYFCGARSYAYMSEIDHMEGNASSEVIGVGPEDELITPGIRFDVMSSSTGFIDEGGVSRFISAMTAICAAEPRTQREPEWLLLSITQDSVVHLVPNRFQREGQRVRFWRETRYTRAATATLRSPTGEFDDIPMEVSVVEPQRGHLLVQEEAMCGTQTLRQLQTIRYNSAGRVVSALNEPDRVSSEVIPGSVGEAIVQMVCLIR